MSTEHWPWWVTSMALAGVATLHYGALGRAFGVSGLFAKVLSWRDERAACAAEAQVADPAAAHAAMVAETLAMLEAMSPEEMGMDAEEFEVFLQGQREELAAAAPPPAPTGPAVAPRAPPEANRVFLGALTLGGLLAALSTGRFDWAWSPAAAYSELLAGGAVPHVALLLGGALVGLGTQMAGGCSAGHGLNGCEALQPGSLAATATFFGTGVVVSLGIGALS
jgi:uncharacterized membrane protein YedE/YeeE